mmetsp:Transcript_77070/g.150973  ORF Transcript_77070/g.150973 Transcript_77070/m.150973 type:complete len:281 (-) Transcript_77070:324-1166(-)
MKKKSRAPQKVKQISTKLDSQRAKALSRQQALDPVLAPKVLLSKMVIGSALTKSLIPFSAVHNTIGQNRRNDVVVNNLDREVVKATLAEFGNGITKGKLTGFQLFMKESSISPKGSKGAFALYGEEWRALTEKEREDFKEKAAQFEAASEEGDTDETVFKESSGGGKKRKTGGKAQIDSPSSSGTLQNSPTDTKKQKVDAAGTPPPNTNIEEESLSWRCAKTEALEAVLGAHNFKASRKGSGLLCSHGQIAVSTCVKGPLDFKWDGKKLKISFNTVFTRD